MAILRVQQTTTYGEAANPTATLGAAAAGNLLVAVLMVATRPLPNVSDLGVTNPTGFTTAITTSFEDVDLGEEGRGCWMRIAYKVAAGGETAVQFGMSDAAGLNQIWAGEYSGGATVAPLDATSSAASQGTFSTITTGTTATTSQADELLIAAGVLQYTSFPTVGSWDGSFTDLVENNQGPFSYGFLAAVGERIVAATGAYGPTYTLTGSGQYRAGAIATFKASSGGADATPPTPAVALTLSVPTITTGADITAATVAVPLTLTVPTVTIPTPSTADWYASSSVSSGGSGTYTDPWPISVAISSANSTIQTGDIVALKGTVLTPIVISKAGVIYETWQGENFWVNPLWTDNPSGSAPGNSAGAAAIRITGAGTTLRSRGILDGRVEVSCRFASAGIRTHFGKDAVSVEADSVTVQAVFIHDAGAGVTSFSGYRDTIVRGCHIQNTGLDEAALSASNYSWYMAGPSGSMKHIQRCMVLQPGLGYVGHWYSEGGSLIGITVEDTFAAVMNIGRGYLIGGAGLTPEVDDVHFNRNWTNNGDVKFGTNFGGAGDNGTVVVDHNYFRKVTVGGSSTFPLRQIEIAETWDNFTFTNNEMYNECAADSNDEGAIQIRSAQPVIFDLDDNAYYMADHSATFERFEPNTYSFSGWKGVTGGDASSSLANTTPPDDVRVLQADMGDACQVWIRNEAGATSVSVLAADLGVFIATGQSYEIRSGQNPLAAAIASGTYNGTSISFPMNAASVAAPLDWGTAAAQPDDLPTELQPFFLVNASATTGTVSTPAVPTVTLTMTVPAITARSDLAAATPAVPLTLSVPTISVTAGSTVAVNTPVPAVPLTFTVPSLAIGGTATAIGAAVVTFGSPRSRWYFGRIRRP